MKNGNISAGRLRLFGGALKWAAYLIWLLVFGPIDRLNHHSGDLGAWLEIALGFVLGTLVWKAGHRYSMLAKKHSSPSADDLVAKDPRPPVIYLRSFLDDSVAAKEEPQWVDGASGGHPYPGPTEEEQLRNIMNQIGPFIAIGNPSENSQNSVPRELISQGMNGKTEY
jgi:hypothetical protein